MNREGLRVVLGGFVSNIRGKMSSPSSHVPGVLGDVRRPFWVEGVGGEDRNVSGVRCRENPQERGMDEKE